MSRTPTLEPLRFLGAFAALCMFAVLGSGCASGEADRRAAARPDVQRMIEYVRSEGAVGVVSLTRNRSGTWRGAAGMAVLQPPRRMRPGDRFRVASVTKTFVATVVLQLVGEGRLRLNDTVERRLPGLLPQGRRITLRQLLNHTSGLYDFVDDARFQARFLRDIRLVVPPRQTVGIAAARPLRFAPGTGWAYSNTGYQILGLMIERVTHEPLKQALTRRIFEPLALRHTSFEPRPSLPEPVAHGYALHGGQLPIPYGRRLDVTQSAGGGAWADGAIVSNVDDIARFYGALFSGKLLRRDLLREMERPVETDLPVRRAGLGVFRSALACGYAWGHEGAMPGYLTQALVSKDGSRVVVMAANGDSTHVAGALAASARNAYCTS
jgi:D-alanyl-D-alanine carboxypeptidase